MSFILLQIDSIQKSIKADDIILSEVLKLRFIRLEVEQSRMYSKLSF